MGRLLSAPRLWLLLVAMLFLALPSLGEDQIPSQSRVRNAIAAFFVNPLGPSAREHLRTIIVFAVESDQVEVRSDSIVHPWMNERMNSNASNLLLGAYVAGDLEAQFQSKKKGDAPVESLRRVFEVYDQMRRAQPDFKSPGLERLRKLSQQGKLLDHIQTERSKLPPGKMVPKGSSQER